MKRNQITIEAGYLGKKGYSEPTIWECAQLYFEHSEEEALDFIKNPLTDTVRFAIKDVIAKCISKKMTRISCITIESRMVNINPMTLLPSFYSEKLGVFEVI